MADDLKAAVEKQLLKTLDADACIDDTRVFAKANNFDHKLIAGIVKSLLSYEMITSEEVTLNGWTLSAEAKSFLTEGSAEARCFNAVPAEGLALDQLKAQLGKVADVGFKQAMVQKWLALEKGEVPTVVRKTDAIVDIVQDQLKAIESGAEVDKKVADTLKKRKLISAMTEKFFKVGKGAKFALEKVKLATDLTQDMIIKGTWKQTQFKEYNFNAKGQPPAGGHVHPLLKVRKEFREIFISMGFEEMPTNNFVESSFWNFDALFQPQQHPARDAHDTFFMTAPQTSNCFPPDYLERVKETHMHGGYGSIGYNYDWKLAEAQKNLMRTHTTAVSSRMLYKLAQDGFRPAKYFSIDRVFRNEAVDRTHLAEFHQIEGVICDKGLTLSDLIGTLHQFFRKIGITQLRFKPAYNPYTEPSMEIFSFHPQLKKWVEIGNSGMFRPEMMEPMGMPADVSVIAWGLSLERPTMILYGIDNIRDLFGHKVNLSMVKSNPVCRLQLQQ
uniref:phenylalanine--tRNA ligase n=1 Tax=Pyramimonas obovata TaxID=1411642 RepID=A0A7S0RKF5_9CHLO|eukprot:CAMPEP_0118930956 /NCGR_PEP_ID=MMETSP1169-20130426/7465_1 /TAXON_ID=36882 /ORGANISM="Pyramimonas obovata, Strain CCMP722" /LENGTH=498 /DNA_ID=CAMNT_0006873391 /DNA_START=27 /DNA_END=1523 /DNA_ORIENTATION=-